MEELEGPSRGSIVDMSTYTHIHIYIYTHILRATPLPTPAIGVGGEAACPRVQSSASF